MLEAMAAGRVAAAFGLMFGMSQGSPTEFANTWQAGRLLEIANTRRVGRPLKIANTQRVGRRLEEAKAPRPAIGSLAAFPQDIAPATIPDLARNSNTSSYDRKTPGQDRCRERRGNVAADGAHNR